MTDEQIAKVLSGGDLPPCPVPGVTFAWLQLFANAIAEEAVKQEREACAIMCEVHAASIINDGKQSAWAIAHECAAAVRSRTAVPAKAAITETEIEASAMRMLWEDQPHEEKEHYLGVVRRSVPGKE